MTHEAIHNISLSKSRCGLASFLQMDYNVYVAIKKVCECYFYYQIKFSIQIQMDSVFLPGRSLARSLERPPTSMVTLS